MLYAPIKKLTSVNNHIQQGIAGAILIDGPDIRDMDIASIRKQIVLVTQETILFNDTAQ